ncbi:hypothetical protein J4526_05035 [Desulfurococcaceae archaeon MEX13E-LK6-19]|nr:hypothetical protein J4526_05035 [Desulfurococcaceae archaeon MEX13E-LK6-19]
MHDPKRYARHITDIVRELDDAEKIALEALKSQGFDMMYIRNLIRLSKLVRNIVDSWYREKIYSNKRPEIT